MSYRHVITPSGIVHGQPDDSDWLVCGKPNEDTIGASIYEDVDSPITCKVCKRSIDLSRDHRLARRLSTLVEELYEDMQARPGAYIHADRNSIALMMAAVGGE